MLDFKTVSIQTPDGAVVETVRAVTGPSVVVIKRLGWRRLEEADKANQKAQIAHVRDLGGPALLNEFREAAAKAETEGNSLREQAEKEAKKNPLALYDKGVLLTIGITEIDGATEPAIRAMLVDEFEPDTADACARAILRLSRPQLFETERERKND